MDSGLQPRGHWGTAWPWSLWCGGGSHGRRGENLTFVVVILWLFDPKVKHRYTDWREPSIDRKLHFSAAVKAKIASQLVGVYESLAQEGIICWFFNCTVFTCLNMVVNHIKELHGVCYQSYACYRAIEDGGSHSCSNEGYGGRTKVLS